MAVEVYFWAPKGSNIGHAAIKVDGGAPAGPSYISAWPGSAISIIFGQGSFNQYNDDVSSEGGSPAVVRLTKLDETAIKAQMETIRRASTYSFIAFNCATQASICLKAGVPGAYIQQITETLLGGPIGFLYGTSTINTPWTLYLYAKLLAQSYA